MIQGLPMAFMLSLVLAIGCGRVWGSNIEVRVPWDLERSRPAWPQVWGIHVLCVTVLGQREQLLSLRSVITPSYPWECLS